MEDATFMVADVAGTANTTLRIDPPRALCLFESVRYVPTGAVGTSRPTASTSCSSRTPM